MYNKANENKKTKGKAQIEGYCMGTSGKRWREREKGFACKL